jgi:hypothetical protein
MSSKALRSTAFTHFLDLLLGLFALASASGETGGAMDPNGTD